MRWRRRHPIPRSAAPERGCSLVSSSRSTTRRAAAIYSLIESAKLNGLNPQHYLADVLSRGHAAGEVVRARAIPAMVLRSRLQNPVEGRLRRAPDALEAARPDYLANPCLAGLSRARCGHLLTRPDRRAPAKRLIRKSGGSRSLTLLYALTFARWSRHPVPPRGGSSERVPTGEEVGLSLGGTDGSNPSPSSGESRANRWPRGRRLSFDTFVTDLEAVVETTGPVRRACGRSPRQQR
jgi:hypothetical protein